jgi:hypothetical protein
LEIWLRIMSKNAFFKKKIFKKIDIRFILKSDLDNTKDQIICSILIFFKNCHLSVAYLGVCACVRVRVCVRVTII